MTIVIFFLVNYWNATGDNSICIPKFSATTFNIIAYSYVIALIVSVNINGNDRLYNKEFINIIKNNNI